MAAWNDVKTVRLNLRDPAGALNLEHVATFADLPVPASVSAQTSYRTDDTYNYYNYDGNAWNLLKLQISDDRLSTLIDLYGVDGATTRCITYIIAGLYDQLNFVRISAGAESTQYQTLNDVLNFYKALKAEFKEDAAAVTKTDTGRVLRMKTPSIGGGMEC